MKYFFITLIIAVLISDQIAAQENEENKYLATGSGLEYYIYSKGRGVQAEKGDKVTVHYTGKLVDGKVFDSSHDRNQPFTFNLGAGQVIKGWDEGIALLHQGDKAVLKVPPELGYGTREIPNIPAGSTLIFDVEVLQVTKMPKIERFDTTVTIPMVTESGLRYFVIEKVNGDAPKAVKGQRVMVHYSGYLKDGKMFDSSVQRNEPITFELGAGQVIPGWDEGIGLMKKGEKFTLVIPYHLAYGEAGRPPVIPQKADLIFDVELVDILPVIIIEPFDISGKKMYTTESGLKYYIVLETEGEKVPANSTVTVHYTGYLDDGSVFDSSVKRDQPFSFPIGMNRVIKGWDEGVALMKKGEKFRFIIPFDLAYGEKGYPPVIPPKAELTFDVELIDFVSR